MFTYNTNQYYHNKKNEHPFFCVFAVGCALLKLSFEATLYLWEDPGTPALRPARPLPASAQRISQKTAITISHQSHLGHQSSSSAQPADTYTLYRCTHRGMGAGLRECASASAAGRGAWTSQILRYIYRCTRPARAGSGAGGRVRRVRVWGYGGCMWHAGGGMATCTVHISGPSSLCPQSRAPVRPKFLILGATTTHLHESNFCG